MQTNPHTFLLEGTNGKAVLLVHGLTGAPVEMKYVGKHLHKQGYTVYSPVLAGHCLDETALLATTYEDWIESLREALRFLKTKYETVHAAGICVGGGLALQLSHLEPGLDKVAIYAAALDYDGWNQPKWSRLARKLKGLLIHIPKIKNAKFAETHPFGVKSERIRNLLIKNGMEGTLPHFPAASLYQNYRLNDSLRAALPNIKTPTLLIHAREDDVSHPRNSYNIQKLHGGKCEVVLLEDSYHMIHVDQEREKVAQLTAEFFDKNI